MGATDNNQLLFDDNNSYFIHKYTVHKDHHSTYPIYLVNTNIKIYTKDL